MVIKHKEELQVKSIWTAFQAAFTTLGGALGWFFGGADGFFIVLLAFVVADYITGVMVAVTEKKLSSAVGFKGIFRKIIIFLLVGVANLLDVHVLGTAAVLRTAVIFFYISNEGISLLENAGHLGVKYPQKLKDVLAQLHNRIRKRSSSSGTRRHRR